MNQIDIIDILQVPRVQWLSADDRHATKHHQAVMRMVKQLVQVGLNIPVVSSPLDPCNCQAMTLLGERQAWTNTSEGCPERRRTTRTGTPGTAAYHGPAGGLAGTDRAGRRRGPAPRPDCPPPGGGR